jgi:hypothetical protein
MSTSAERVSRSTWSRSRALNTSMVLEASWWRTPDGLRFQLVKGTPEEAEVLAAVVAWDRSQESGP